MTFSWACWTLFKSMLLLALLPASQNNGIVDHVCLRLSSLGAESKAEVLMQVI